MVRAGQKVECTPVCAATKAGKVQGKCGRQTAPGRSTPAGPPRHDPGHVRKIQSHLSMLSSTLRSPTEPRDHLQPQFPGDSRGLHTGPWLSQGIQRFHPAQPALFGLCTPCRGRCAGAAAAGPRCTSRSPKPPNLPPSPEPKTGQSATTDTDPPSIVPPLRVRLQINHLSWDHPSWPPFPRAQRPSFLSSTERPCFHPS
jgi:hypothetical protein